MKAKLMKENQFSSILKELAELILTIGSFIIDILLGSIQPPLLPKGVDKGGKGEIPRNRKNVVENGILSEVSIFSKKFSKNN